MTNLKPFLSIFTMLSEIFIEFPRRIFHAPKDGQRFDDTSVRMDEYSVTLRSAERPSVPGEVLAEIDTNGKGVRDFSRLSVERGSAVLSALYHISENLGRNYWIVGSFGWLAEDRETLTFTILPDPWHIIEDFIEETGQKRTFDPLTDVIMDGIRVKKFQIRYGDAHMTGAVLAGEEFSDFMKLKRIIGAMRTQYGKMRAVLYPQRHALLERGKMPSIGYHVLTFNYNEPQLIIIPRIFVPKSGNWGPIELFYNGEVSRDLEGETAERFWIAHRKLAEDFIKQAVK